MAGWVAQEVGIVLNILTIINKKQDTLLAQQQQLIEAQEPLVKSLGALISSQQKIEEELAALSADVAKILETLAPRPAVGFTAEISSGS